jgi:hypothetical protein
LVIERATFAGLAPVEAPERHSSPRWFATNDARFRIAMQWAIDHGLVSLPSDGAGTSPPAGPAMRGPADGE